MKSVSLVIFTSLFLPAAALAQTNPAADAGKPSSQATAPAATGQRPALKEGEIFAKADLVAKSGSKATGTVSFKRTKDGVEVSAHVSGAKTGQHGFHIHAVGDCSSADGKSAGDHYNPGNKPHAAPNAAERHVGDLGNITLDKKGEGKLSLKLKDPKDFANWAEIVGKSVILHEGQDDLKSQPSGNAGARIACGVIESSSDKKAAKN